MGRLLRSSLLAVALACALACTSRGSDTEVSAQPELRDAVQTSPELLPPSGRAVPGFAIYTEDRTILVPIDGSPRMTGEGLWVQDDRVSPPAVSHTLLMTQTRAAIMELPRCACLALAGACEDDSVESRAFDTRTGAVIEEPTQACTCLRKREALASSGAELEVVSSLVGGWLLDRGEDGTARGRALIESPPKLSSVGMRSAGCARPIDHGASVADCELEDYDSQLFLLRRGQLWELRDSIGERTRWTLQRPVRPSSCPSSNDPCGDPSRYRERARLDRPQREYWIATDGSATLTAERHAYTLWRADGTSVEFELPNIDASTDVIGVRVHADLGPLRALIGEYSTLGVDRPERAPTTIAAEECLAQVGAAEPGYAARALGDDCFRYVGLERWADAEASCLAGLAVAEQPRTRGAILHNLGRIAEAEGAHEQAGVYFRESLALRPNSRAEAR